MQVLCLQNSSYVTKMGYVYSMSYATPSANAFRSLTDSMEQDIS
jgi:hypothetical protein